MKKLLLSTILSIVAFTSYSQAGWDTIPSPTTDRITGVHFANDTLGFICAEQGKVYKTDDGGNSWFLAYDDTSASFFNDLYYTSDFGVIWVVGTNGTIITSNDHGATWTAQSSGTIESLQSVWTADGTGGFTVGGSGTVLKTTNSAVSWGDMALGSSFIQYSVDFWEGDENMGLVAGANGSLYHTSDAGTTWVNVNISGITDDYFGVFLENTNGTFGIAVGEAGRVIYSSDGGVSWDSLPAPVTSNTLTDVHAVSDMKSWTVGLNGVILNSIDGAENWMEQITNNVTNENLRDLWMVNDSIGYAVGDNGIILKTTNGGNYKSASLNVSVKNVGCNGEDDGKITVTPNGGTPPYTYQWSGGAAASTDSIADFLLAGTYTVSVVDAVNDTVDTTVTISEPTELIVDAGVDTFLTCSSCCDGSASVVSSGGVTPYTYSWSAGQSDSIATALCLGYQMVTVEDANGCFSVDSVYMEEETVDFVMDTTGAGNGCPPVTVTVTNTSNIGDIYAWFFEGEGPYYVYDTSFTFTTGGEKNIALFAFDSNTGDQLGESYQQINLSGSSGDFFVTSDSTCEGDELFFDANQGEGVEVISWDLGDGAVVYQNNFTHNYDVAGDYMVELIVNSNTCGYDTITKQITVRQDNITPDPMFFTDPYVSCPKDEIVFLAVDATGEFTWSFGNGEDTTTTETAFLYSYEEAGEYPVTLNVTNGCGNSASYTDTVSIDSTLSGFELSMQKAYSDSVCPGDMARFNYEGNRYSTVIWDFGDGTSDTGRAVTHEYASADTYSISMTVVNGCGVDSTVYDSIYVGANLAASPEKYSYGVIPPTACPEDTVLFYLDGKVSSFSWDFGDGNAATETDAVSFGEITDFVANAYADTGVYDAVLSVTNGCGNSFSDTMQVSIENNAPLMSPFGIGFIYDDSDAGPPVTCEETQFTALVGGNEFVWNFGDGDSLKTNDIVVSHTYTSAGFYEVTLKAMNACGDTGVFTQIIEVAGECSQLAANVNGVSPTCETGHDGMIAVTPVAGTAPYSYNWNTGHTSDTIINVKAGTYSVTVTDADSNSVVETIMLPDGVGTTITSTIASSQDISCFGECDGKVLAAAAGGDIPYQFAWNNGKTGKLQVGLCAGEYSYTVSDQIGCKDTGSVTLTEPDELVLSSTINDASCGDADGSASVTASGGTTPYIYAWSTGDTTTTADSLESGLYLVRVNDADGCEKQELITISDANGPVITIDSVQNVSCFGNANGAITATVTGGTTPYAMEWSNGATAEDISGLVAGPYELNVQDDNGCVAVKSVLVSRPDQLEVTGTVTPASCGSSDGEISIEVSGGTTPYSYNWSTGGTDSLITGLSWGSYSVTVTDGNGCTATKSKGLSETGAPEVSIDSISDATCLGTSGEVNITTTGGVLPYTYEWSNGSTAEDLINVAAGEYSLTVTSADSCMAVENVEVGELLPDTTEICLVTVDTTTGTNLVVWTKGDKVAQYNIYKESTQSGVYYQVGSVPYDSLSEFTDTLSDPLTRSWRYKIAGEDSCGNESVMSSEHKTIHLTINLGLNNSINLIWDDYQGFDFNTYYIHRYSAQNGWEILDSLPNTLKSYTDTALTGLTDLFYIVEAKHPDGCVATKAKNYNSARSNKSPTINESGEGGYVIDRSAFRDLNVFPNPNTGTFNIKFTLQQTSELTINIYDVKGSLVIDKKLNHHSGAYQQEFDLSNHESGLYYIQLMTENEVISRKVIVQ